MITDYTELMDVPMPSRTSTDTDVSSTPSLTSEHLHPTTPSAQRTPPAAATLATGPIQVRAPAAAATGASSPSSALRGVLAALFASVLFGAMFYLAGIVDAAPEVIFGWRVLLTLLCYGVILLSAGGRHGLRRLRASLTAHWWTPLLLVVTALLVGLQMWLFAWAPAHGYALDASLGYLLLPIALVLTGRVLFKEHVSRFQLAAVLPAVLVVGVKVVVTATISWVTFAICIGYALYFALRRRFRIGSPAAFGAEVAVLSPIAIALIITGRGPASPGDAIAIIAIGLAGAAAMAAYLSAAAALSMPLFGLLSYAEPVLLFLVALLLGERLETVDIVTYSVLGLSLALLAADGFQARRRST